MYVEKQMNDGSWVQYRSDGDWDTKFVWKPKRDNPTEAVVVCMWSIDNSVDSGTYRILHQAYYPSLFGGYIFPYSGYSSTFMVNV